MTVAELIEELRKCPPDAEVDFRNTADSMEPMPVDNVRVDYSYAVAPRVILD